MNEVNAYAKEKGSQIRKVMNCVNAVAEGLVLDIMQDHMELGGDYLVVHDCPIYNMDSKKYHDDVCLKSVCYHETFKKIVHQIQGEGDKIINQARDALNLNQSLLEEYKTICDEIQMILEEHPEVKQQIGDETPLMTRVANSRSYYKNTQFMEHNLENIKEYKKSIEELIKKKGRRVVPVYTPFRK